MGRGSGAPGMPIQEKALHPLEKGTDPKAWGLGQNRWAVFWPVESLSWLSRGGREDQWSGSPGRVTARGYPTTDFLGRKHR